jgi:hypothetical protein
MNREFDASKATNMGASDELIFDVTQEADGGYCAECLTPDIFAQAINWTAWRENVREAVAAYFLIGRRRTRFAFISVMKCSALPEA